jgi:hypothetical protein
MIYNLKQASEPSLIKANNLSESDVKKIVLGGILMACLLTYFRTNTEEI